MAFSTAQKAILGVAGLGAVGFGGYFVVQQAEVRKYEKDRADIVSLIDTEKKRAATATKAQSGAEERIAELQLAEQQSFKAIKDLELKLDAARKQVQQLEQQLNSKTEDLKAKQTDLAAAHQRLAELKNEAERAKQSVTMGERSLALAAAKVTEAKALTNPLNHPKVKELLGKK
ncbi:hypothetical protein CHLRE_10g434200v5 [Chlamydomonas reinhardtii]|uniref:Uncharacterized protein n=1 Tax=Chlamydomonas reinhardtii TaxID=3055 RepID=A8IAV8_CHLRE|nr:uncharacterized protein CHLRE_10g434200v5 [Chlamydomonas reinhardtii]PNW77384.1 hypothetical protein CHLRE_10g434200v5 [Chlamydomonas reinhardtii]|eukprot:XP_001702471.1 predicted protein [Chlamydomonas reinhardtii]